MNAEKTANFTIIILYTLAVNILHLRYLEIKQEMINV